MEILIVLGKIIGIVLGAFLFLVLIGVLCGNGSRGRGRSRRSSGGYDDWGGGSSGGDGGSCGGGD